MKYRLSIHGTVEYDECGRDERTRLLLLGATSTMMASDTHFKMAVQELEEEARDIRISMDEIEENDEGKEASDG